MRCTLRQDEVNKIDEMHMDIRYEFIFSEEVFRFRYTPIWNCQWQQINYCLNCVFSESPFEMVIAIRSSFQMKCTTRSTCQMKCTLRSDIPPSQNQKNVKFWLFPELPLTKKWKKCQFSQGKSVHKGLQTCTYIGFWVCQSQCTVWEFCVTSTFWVNMVFLHFYGKIKI